MKFSLKDFFSKCDQIRRKLGKNFFLEKNTQVHLIIIRERPPIKRILPTFPPGAFYLTPYN